MILVSKETKKFGFYKKCEGDKIWWVHYIGRRGSLAVSFDKKRILNLFQDYPKNFTPEEKELFDKENPYWVNFFSDRDESPSKKNGSKKTKKK